MSTAAEAKDEKDKTKAPRDPAREVVETIVFVVVLVLLLKLFVTEAFVIPTGSMAETLYGYQKIITCLKCGHQFPVNATAEVDGVAPPNNPNGPKERHYLTGYCCPNCRYLGRVKDLNPIPGYNSGDRVLVLKPLYHLRSPRRGDVVVFKYPEKPQDNHIAANYIKRAMGFGGETVAIHRGKLYVTRSLTYPEGELFPRPEDPLDLWQKKYMFENHSPAAQALFEASRAAGFTDQVAGGFQIVRKEEDQLLADLRIVWDNDKQPHDLAGLVPPRWEVLGAGARWTPDDRLQPRAFKHDGAQQDWIRYQHLVWKQVNAERVPWRWVDKNEHKPVAGPVDNMLGYNAGMEVDQKDPEQRLPPKERGEETRWVGDLSLECAVEIADGAEVVLELSKGLSRFRAKFGSGQVALSRTGPEPAGVPFGTPTRACKVAAGAHKLRFANIDCRLWVWVDGKRIDFGAEAEYTSVETTNYDPEDTLKEGWVRANDIDAPANIGATGAVSVRGIKLFRDIYYTRNSGDQSGADIFYVQPGHYMCLGDNSAQSSDSRTWGTVPERLLLGKAVFVFWPGWPKPSRIGFIH